MLSIGRATLFVMPCFLPWSLAVCFISWVSCAPRSNRCIELLYRYPSSLSSSALDVKYLIYIRVLPKVRKSQHQYPEFRQKQGEIQKKPCKKSTLERKAGWNFWVSPCLSFFPECLHWCYIYFHCSYLYSHCNFSRTVCIKCWVSAFHTEF
jgi:hypothetical protein